MKSKYNFVEPSDINIEIAILLHYQSYQMFD
jgi:hypothetical protein